MRRNLFAGKLQTGGLTLNIFTNDALGQIHSATLEVMERKGLFMEDKEAREILDGGGAKVDEKAKTLKFPLCGGGECSRGDSVHCGRSGPRTGGFKNGIALGNS